MTYKPPTDVVVTRTASSVQMTENKRTPHLSLQRKEEDIEKSKDKQVDIESDNSDKDGGEDLVDQI